MEMPMGDETSQLKPWQFVHLTTVCLEVISDAMVLSEHILRIVAYETKAASRQV